MLLPDRRVTIDEISSVMAPPGAAVIYLIPLFRRETMIFEPSMDLREAADDLFQLADLIEQTKLSASDVGFLLADSFRRSPVEQPADIRRSVIEMCSSNVDPATLAAGLRQQAEELREMSGGKMGW